MTIADYFLATDEEFSRGFPGWKHSAPLLEEPYTKKLRNPFTGEELEKVTRVPEEQPTPDPDAAEAPDFTAFDRVDLKGVDSVALAHLAEIAIGWSRENASDEVHGRVVHGPEESEVVVLQVPQALTARMASATAGEIEDMGRRWSERRREDARTIPQSGVREMLVGIPDSVWIDALQTLADLAKKAAGDRKMYLWISP